jgi:hypothetical protein
VGVLLDGLLIGFMARDDIADSSTSDRDLKHA